MDIKEILNQVLSQSGFLKKSSFTSNPDVEDEQMIAIANRVAYEITGFYDWGGIRKTFTITPTTGVTQYNMPDDFLSIVPDSVWEADGSRRVEFPVPDNRWYLYKFSAFSNGGTIRAKMYGNVMEIADPETGDEINLEYISKYPIRSSTDIGKEFFTSDDDTWVLDDQLLILGIQAHWQQAKLMPSYQEHMGNYMRKMNEAIGRSAGSRTIGGFGYGHNGRRDPYYPLYRSGS